MTNPGWVSRLTPSELAEWEDLAEANDWNQLLHQLRNERQARMMA